jgi:hypothetical protein
METVIVCIAVGLAVLFVVGRFLRNLSANNAPTGCGCECTGGATCGRLPEDLAELNHEK